MTVEILRLSGGGDGAAAASALLDDIHAHPDLSRLLVVDETTSLLCHLTVYERLLTSRRLDHLLCLAVGPRAADGGEFRFPASISGAQGSAVIWVSDPNGIDWRLAASAVAVGHTGTPQSGLHHLVELLSVDDVFDRVCDIARNVPGGVTSPGLRLTGMEDEGARFIAALTLAIQRLITADPASAVRTDEPFAPLLATPAGTPGLAERGELSRYHEDVITSHARASDALAEHASLEGLLGRDQADVPGQVRQTGAALYAFRHRVARLLTEADAPGGLTEAQREQLRSAGIKLPVNIKAAEGAGTSPAGGPSGGDAKRSPVSEAIAGAVQSGDTLPRITRRLNLTASALTRPGSASYLTRLDGVCPPALVDGLTGAPEPPPPWRWVPAAIALPVVIGVLTGFWRPVAGIVIGLLVLAGAGAGIAWSWRAQVAAWRREVQLDQVPAAADEVARLVTTAAASEWHSAEATAGQLTRARIAIQAVHDELASQAQAAQAGGRAARAMQPTEALLEGLCHLVVEAVEAGTDPIRVGGEAISVTARGKAAQLLRQWQEDVRTGQAPAWSRSAPSGQDHVTYAGDDELAAITASILYDPRDVMWQLCTPADLSALDLSATPHLVALAPRAARARLAEALPEDTIWSSSGEQAGLLRLVPLHAQIVNPVWTADEQH